MSCTDPRPLPDGVGRVVGGVGRGVWGLRDEGLDLKSRAKRVFSFIKRSILILLGSVSVDFESKNGIRGSESTIIGSGWVIVSEVKD